LQNGDLSWKVPVAIAAAANPEFDSCAPADYSFFPLSCQAEFWETVGYGVPRSRRIQEGRGSGRFHPSSPSA
jgi:hypothetical protein